MPRVTQGELYKVLSAAAKPGTILMPLTNTFLLPLQALAECRVHRAEPCWGMVLKR